MFMKTNQHTSPTFIITRDGHIDIAYYTKQATKGALRGLGKALWFAYARVGDDINHNTKFMDEWREWYNIAEARTEDIVIEFDKNRNRLGQFTS
jgi:hypothetical protein